MGLNVGQMVSGLRRMTVPELKQRYAEVFGEQTRSYHKVYLIRRIAWRVQANSEGGLPAQSRHRAMEFAFDGDRSRSIPLPAALAPPCRWHFPTLPP
ncbi:MAG: DUF2924 domain-containing protein [Phycisphaeraceae bacterium]|nr:DUF2924 domain-containing protein [Phycisphaeraceae bacterium]